jgi:D-alanyl-lipoteichoic acid acyltransferase DltB (MBOAT superfamily)
VSAINPIPVAALALLLALYYLVPRRGLQTGLLLAASGAFYLHFFGRGFWLLLILAAAFYAGGLGASRGGPPARRRAFALALAGSLALFLILRYWEALAGLLPSSASWAGAARSGIVLPVGLSFFLFKGLSYLIDVRRGRAEAAGNPVQLSLYLFFFPQVTAGPIQRWGSFRENLRLARRWDAAALYQGAKLLLLGAFKKMVVADRLAFYVNQVFAAPEGKGLHVALAACLYSVQIYADFSGYSDMANGAARLFGHAETPNFSFPYLSRSIPEFWRRWHVTLSTWLRDYLFLPLSFAVSRRLKKERLLGLKAEHWIYSSATLLTMGLAGFWHGARWTFVLWGLLFGVYMSVGQLSRRMRSRLRRRVFGGQRLLRDGASMLATFALVTFAWVFFRSPSLAAAWKFISAAGPGLPAFGLGHLYLNLLLALALALVDLAQKSRPRIIAACPPWGKAAALALALCLVILLSVDTGNEFIYLRF